MTNETSVSSVIVIHSSLPLQDATFLFDLLSDADGSPWVQEEEELDESNATTAPVVLVSTTRNVSILFAPSYSTSKAVAVWVVQGDEELLIRQVIARGNKHSNNNNKMREIHQHDLEGCRIVEIRLPSGSSSLLLVPSTLVSSRTGRLLLSQRIARWTATSDSADDYSPDIVKVEPQQDSSSLIPVLPPPKSLFPTLQVNLLQQHGEFTPFVVNSPIGQDFETDLFKGKILMVMRPEDPTCDPYWNERMFSKRKRRILVQIQGQFKVEPTGIVYAGAEVSHPMKLGLLARGLSGVLLRIVEGFNPSVHYAYGTTANNGVKEEKAHIVVPAYSFFERVVVTPPGDTPPVLGSEFDESKESLAKRKNPKTSFQFNASDTYSFSFYSMYVDLPTWQLVNLPIPKGDISLKTFWHDSLLRICMYEKTGFQKEHLQELNRYAFLLQVKYTDVQDDNRQETENLFLMSGSKYVEGSRGSMENQSSESSQVSIILNRSESQLFPIDDETTNIEQDVTIIDDDDHDQFEDAVQDHQLHPCLEEKETHPILTPTLITTAAPPLLHSSVELLSRIDTHCPFFLDTIKNRGGYSRVYIIRVNDQSVFRTLRDCEELVESSKKAQRIVDDTFSPRMSGSERLRRVTGCILASPSTTMSSDDGRNKLASFVKSPRTNSAVEGLFLRRTDPNLNDRERASLKWSGFVARAVSDRHWIEEYVRVTCRSISFQHPDKRKASARIMIRSIETVAALPAESCPAVSGYWFLEIETLGRSIYLLFGSEHARSGFANEIQSLRSAALDEEATSSIASNSIALDIENPADEFMHKSTMWNMKNRRLLNGGKFYFAVSKSGDALALVSDALQRASLVANESYDEYEQRHAFLVSAARLKQAHVLHLPEEWRLVFFLNLYHLMILHAFIILGPPDSSLQWITYFNNAAYETADDIFSLAELEHCIIRSNMSSPSQFLSRFVIPKSHYRMALSKCDYRINFALNCGSLSNPTKVFCYNVVQLQHQLSAATRLYLESTSYTLRGGTNELILQLPRVCQWYMSDFGDSTEDMLIRIEPYLQDNVRRVLERFKTADGHHLDMSAIAVRYFNYNFDCRPFVVQS